MKKNIHSRTTMFYNIGHSNCQNKDIDVLISESAIPANDCNKDNYLFDLKNNLSYLVLEN